jgi:nucleotide-binding universal stress UspA family protein
MYRRVLVGVDGGDGGRDAIALAAELVDPDGGVILAHVHAGYPIIGRGASPVYEATERQRASELLNAERRRAGIDAEVQAIGCPSVGRGLHELGEQLGADLIVVGSTRRGLAGRVLIGDDTRAALDGAPCAVAISPAGYAEHPKAIREIGVAYDETSESEYALGVGRRLAKRHAARVSVLEAIEVPVYNSVTGPVPVDLPYTELLDEARARLATLDGVEAHVVYGHAAEELAVYSASVALLVIGSRGYGPLGRLIYGSTVRRLTRNALCPLLVVRRPSGSGDETNSENSDPIATGV